MHFKGASIFASILCGIHLTDAFAISSYRGSDCHGQDMGRFMTAYTGSAFCDTRFINPEASSVFVTSGAGDENHRIFSLPFGDSDRGLTISKYLSSGTRAIRS